MSKLGTLARSMSKTQTQMVSEFQRLPMAEQLDMIQELLRIVAEQVQTNDVQRPNGKEAHLSLAEAASLLLSDYQEDQELTIFTALDGEPFYAQG